MNVSGAASKHTLSRPQGTESRSSTMTTMGSLTSLLSMATAFTERGSAYSRPVPQPGRLEVRRCDPEGRIDHTGWGQGVCAGDIDNDGNVDLFVPGGGKTSSHNRGNGTFRDETQARGLYANALEHWMRVCRLQPRWRSGSGGGQLSRFRSAGTPHPGESGANGRACRSSAAREASPAKRSRFIRMTDTGILPMSPSRPGSTPQRTITASVLVDDFDNDGWPDIYIACDSTPSLYYHNRQGRAFRGDGVWPALPTTRTAASRPAWA